MSLAERLSQPETADRGGPCSVATALESLSERDADALSAALSDSAVSSERIYRDLMAEGVHVGRQTVGRHRRRQCKCFS